MYRTAVHIENTGDSDCVDMIKDEKSQLNKKHSQTMGAFVCIGEHC